MTKMISGADSTSNKCGNNKKNDDQVSPARVEDHCSNPCLVCESTFHQLLHGVLPPVPIQQLGPSRGNGAEGTVADRVRSLAACRLKSERTMTPNAKTKADKKPKQETSRKDQQNQLDRELADTFSASDPPSVTHPSIKLGAPERKPSSRK
jgi:predicted small lipoprotein YifL